MSTTAQPRRSPRCARRCALLDGIEPAALWRSAQRGATPTRSRFSGHIRHDDRRDARRARNPRHRFRNTASLEASIEAILIAANWDHALCASVLTRIAPIRQDAAPEFRGVSNMRRADGACCRRAGPGARLGRRRRAYARAGWHTTLRSRGLGGNLPATHRAYRKLGAVRDLKRLSAGDGQRANADPRSRGAARAKVGPHCAGLANKRSPSVEPSVKDGREARHRYVCKVGIRRVQLARLLAPPPGRTIP